MKSSSSLTRIISPPGEVWAWTMPLDGIATSAAKTSAVAKGNSRLSDRGFDFNANSFTSLPFATIHRTAAVAKKV